VATTAIIDNAPSLPLQQQQQHQILIKIFKVDKNCFEMKIIPDRVIKQIFSSFSLFVSLARTPIRAGGQLK